MIVGLYRLYAKCLSHGQPLAENLQCFFLLQVVVVVQIIEICIWEGKWTIGKFVRLSMLYFRIKVFEPLKKSAWTAFSLAARSIIKLLEPPALKNNLIIKFSCWKENKHNNVWLAFCFDLGAKLTSSRSMYGPAPSGNISSATGVGFIFILYCLLFIYRNYDKI